MHVAVGSTCHCFLLITQLEILFKLAITLLCPYFPFYNRLTKQTGEWFLVREAESKHCVVHVLCRGTQYKTLTLKASSLPLCGRVEVQSGKPSRRIVYFWLKYENIAKNIFGHTTLLDFGSLAQDIPLLLHGRPSKCPQDTMA